MEESGACTSEPAACPLASIAFIPTDTSSKEMSGFLLRTIHQQAQGDANNHRGSGPSSRYKEPRGFLQSHPGAFTLLSDLLSPECNLQLLHDHKSQTEAKQLLGSLGMSAQEIVPALVLLVFLEGAVCALYH